MKIKTITAITSVLISSTFATTNSNDGFTFGDKYNNGQIYKRNSDSFQKDSTAISRDERSDGTNSEQRRTFLTKETREHGAQIKASAHNNQNLSNGQWGLTNQATVREKGEIELHANRYRNDLTSKDKNFGQRVNSNNQRVIVPYKSDRTNKTAAQQDSTYIRKDADMDWTIQRIIDCSTVKMDIYQLFSCPNGMTLADNAETGTTPTSRWGLNRHGYEYNYSNSVPLPPQTDVFDWWHPDNGSVWSTHKLVNGVNQIETIIDRDKINKGASRYLMSYFGKGKIYASSEQECYKKINVNDPNSYTSVSGTYKVDNCAKNCTNNRSDEGTEIRREFKSCATYSGTSTPEEEKRGIFRKFVSNERDLKTIGTEYPQGAQVLIYTKVYLHKNAKGYYRLTQNKGGLKVGDVIPACEAYKEELSQTLNDCIRDTEKENILRVKWNEGTNTGGGTGGGNIGGGGTITGGGTTPPNHNAEEIGSKKQTDASDANKATGTSKKVSINGQSVDKIVYLDKDKDMEYFLDGSNKVYIEYDPDNGVFIIAQ